MTFVQLQNQVMNRLNLTSTDARTRIKVELNLRYREIQSGVNLSQTRRGITTFTIDPHDAKDFQGRFGTPHA